MGSGESLICVSSGPKGPSQGDQRTGDQPTSANSRAFRSAVTAQRALRERCQPPLKRNEGGTR
jgi:hypothetical protein